MVDFDEINEHTELQRKETLKWARSMSEHSQERPGEERAGGGKKVYSIEAALELIGGFGRFQGIMTSILFTNYIKQGLVYYPLPYMELMPQFKCFNHVTNLFELCEPEDFCGKDVLMKYDYDAPTSLHNWVEKLDLACLPSEKIGYIGSAYFVGVLASVLVIPRLADIYGRKRPILYCQVGQLLAVLAFFVMTAYWQAVFLFFVFGLGFGGTVSVGVIYAQEFMMHKHRAFCIAAYGVIDGAIVAFLVAYFYFISKEW